ncbi:MAG: DUF87 domain-containing protein [Bacillota bacterium]
MSRVLTENVIGFFKGFSPSGLDPAAEVVAPYRADINLSIGGFLLVEVSPDECLLGRITRYHPAGVMSSAEGDEYLARLCRNAEAAVPEDVKESKLRYVVLVRLLGSVIAGRGDALEFNPAVRRLPHLGARVGLPSQRVVEFICRLGALLPTGEPDPGAAPIGHFALGREVYDGSGGRPAIPVSFQIHNLVGRRTYVFARAGYGKSNLIKLLLAKLYEDRRTIDEKVGLIVFDPEGEYGWSHGAGQPGLADVPHLRDRLVIYTNRTPPNAYRRLVGGNVKFNLASLRPSDVVDFCLPREKQEMIFASILRGLSPNQWETLIQRLAARRYAVPVEEIRGILGVVGQGRDVSLEAIANNIVPLIDTMHDPKSRLREGCLHHLAKGNIVVVDISLLGSAAGERVAALLLWEVFTNNQRTFASPGQPGLKTVAVIEEAQAVLSQHQSESSPFVQWVKEGRKYDLGAIMVTQQPGSIDTRLLSQGDNFFAFHLTSAADLSALERVNAHFSQDVLANLLSEPIRGNAHFWAAPAQPFVLPVRVLNFEAEYRVERAVEGAKETTASDTRGLQATESAGAVPTTGAMQTTKVGRTAGTTGSTPPAPNAPRGPTPAEAFEQDYQRTMKRFCDLVEEALLTEPSVRLWSNPKVGGSTREDVYLVNEWNLAFAVGDRMKDPEMCRLFSSQLKDRVCANPDRLRPALATRGWLATPQTVTQTSKNNQNAYLVLVERLKEAASQRNLKLDGRIRPYAEDDLEVHGLRTTGEGEER